MSERFNRPRTPPGPPPSSSSNSRKSARGPGGSSATSKPLSKSYGDRSFEKYDKTYKSSAYHSNKDYPEDKYKSGKLSDNKVAGSKYVSKSVYIDDNYKVGGVGGSHYASSSSQRYSDNNKDSYSTKFADKGRYGTEDKYHNMTSAVTSSSSQYGSKKYDDYSTYSPDKASRYPKQDSGGASSYYGNSFDPYGSYDDYRAERNRGGGGGSGYGSERVPVGALSYGSGSSRVGGGYAGDKVSGGSVGYGSDKLSRGGGNTYGVDKPGRGGGGGSYGGSGKPGTSSLSYGGDLKPAGPSGRSQLYGDDRRLYGSSYSPSRTARSDVRGGFGGGSYDDYAYGTTSGRATEKQYLDRYVIGDSVVYGPPGQYPRNLQPSSSPGGRPPSPPSPPLLSRNYGRYSATSPRRTGYSSGRRSLSPTTSSAYRAMSPSGGGGRGRRPPSPPSSRRPPSPDSLYMRGGRDRSFDSSRPKESRYNINNNNNKVGASRSPLRDNRGATDRRDDSRLRVDDRSGRRDSDRRLGSREKANSLDGNKRGRLVDHRGSDYQGANNARNWGKDNFSSNVTQSQRDDRNPHTSPARNIRRDPRADTGSRDRGGRRIEDRLSMNPHPPSGGSRRSPVPRAPRMGRNAVSPRDGNNKKPRRPDDLRLWIESRKNEGGKKGPSRPVGKGGGTVAARSGDRSKLKRPRRGDPKRRLGGKPRGRPGGAGGGPLRRNQILNKYKRLAAKRGMRTGGASTGAGGRYGNRTNRDSGSNRRGEGDHDDNENSKPGSTASIRRVIKKPRKVSQVNNLEIRPRVMGKPLKKLLKDPKKDGGDEKDDDRGSKNRQESDRHHHHHMSQESDHHHHHPSSRSHSSRDEASRDEGPRNDEKRPSTSRDDDADHAMPQLRF